MNERIRILRNELGLSQEAFGKSLGVGKTAISKIELGENKLSEQMIKLICKEYNVSIAWLKEGLGDMFTNLPETLLDELANTYNLSNLDKKIVKMFLDLNKNDRDKFVNTLKKLFIDE